MRKYRIFACAVACLLAIGGTASAQISSGGKPVSLQQALKAGVPTATMPDIDVKALLAEDEEEAKLGIPFRFGFPHEVDFNLDNSGVWETLDDGSRVWRLAIRCPGAYSINLIYDDYHLPRGARLFLYNEDRSMVLGAFTSRNNKEHGMFSTAPIKGDLTVLEYHVPANAAFRGDIGIETIIHGYKNIFFSRSGLEKMLGFGSSGDCNINVNCPQGDPWQDEIRAVAMITTQSGSRICSGALINNATEDLTPFFLTAEHCLGGEETWVIMFNYESPTCDDIDGPTWMTVSGTTLLSHYNYSDFALLELSEQPPDSYNVFYAGWSAVNEPSPSSVGIHHPSGDIKKISFDYDPVTSTDYFNSSGDSHWQVGQWEEGTTEGGSSGSPLIDPDHHIVGQLHGGWASCKIIRADWYGKFAKSWDYGVTPETRLRDWLDPGNTGILTLDGTDPLIVTFEADVTMGWHPLTVNFSASSMYPIDAWSWDFGDGGSSALQSPAHTYDTPGAFDVSLEAYSGGDVYHKTRVNYIIVLADTLAAGESVGQIGSSVRIDVYARNNFPLDYLRLPFEYGGELPLVLDSFSTVGCRTEYFENQDFLHYDPAQHRICLRLVSSTDGSQPELEPGAGLIVRVYFTIEGTALPNQTTAIQTDGYELWTPSFQGSIAQYAPHTVAGAVTYVTDCCAVMGDFDHNGSLNPLDATNFCNWLWRGWGGPVCLAETDVDGDGQIDPLDAVRLVNYFWRGGPGPESCP